MNNNWKKELDDGAIFSAIKEVVKFNYEFQIAEKAWQKEEAQLKVKEVKKIKPPKREIKWF